MKLSILTLLALPLLLFSCKKGSNAKDTQGISGRYTGLFDIDYTNTNSRFTGNVTLELKSSRFSASLINNNLTITAAGTYTSTDSTINFIDTALVQPVNADRRVYLGGGYRYKIKGDSLFLIRLTANTIEQFGLKRKS